MLLFVLLYLWVIFQRCFELWVARKNEAWMKAKGGVEHGSEHYPWMVVLHTAFLLSLLFEAYLNDFALFTGWPILLILFLGAQGLRAWTLTSLGRFWNLKVITLPGETIIQKGPYRWLKHPNYLVVMAEILLLPLMFQAYVTAVVFTIVNACMLFFIRIPIEERALEVYDRVEPREK
ncbi:isoprenylcysteine carboxyl methyltransferase family protein [Natribacillus halophilus]|uniref:15-methylpalmitoyl-4-hydroxy-2-pyrone 4-O-methyltransferase n=1 Tax=Natribacillus halophilus TaxID=549003 RepID=A0A1G8PCB3_9BACI|nr:isoprenylcysteine carboxylmethyltransferase family protein [Natribacillus halophilus]SDI90211.1 15-methylpalmitoyl-4-hydroxy-2-pyrone 4-O-methyltransferase [Natribacillus halophilus]